MMSTNKHLKNAFLYIVISAVLLFYLLPYIWMVMSTFRSPSDAFSNGIFPQKLVLTNYRDALKDPMVVKSLLNSLFCAFSTGVLTMLLAVTTAYGFSRFRFKGRSFLMGFLLNLRTFPGLLLALAIFAMAVKLGLYDTYDPIILANTMLNLPFAIWNCISIIDGIPYEMEESAMVEGLNRLACIRRIVLPIASPGIVASFIYVFILSWNEYMFATTFIQTEAKRLITTVIAGQIGQFAVDYTGLLTISVIATVPIIILFLCIQRFIVSGLALGGVKG